MYSSKDMTPFTNNFLNLPPSTFRHILPTFPQESFDKIPPSTKFVYETHFQHVLPSKERDVSTAKDLAFIHHSIASPTKSAVKRKNSGNLIKKIPRPRNSFMIYRQNRRTEVVAQNPGINDSQVSVILGEMWRKEDEEVKTFFRDLANEEKRTHSLKYPDYKYQPKRKPKVSKKNTTDDAVKRDERVSLEKTSTDLEKSLHTKTKGGPQYSSKRQKPDVIEVVHSTFSSNYKPVTKAPQKPMLNMPSYYPYVSTPEMIVITDEEDTGESATSSDLYYESTSLTPELPFRQQEAGSQTPELINPLYGQLGYQYHYQTQSARHLYTPASSEEYTQPHKSHTSLSEIEQRQFNYPSLAQKSAIEARGEYTCVTDSEVQQYLPDTHIWSHLSPATPLLEFQSNLFQLEQSLLQLLEPNVYEESYLDYGYEYGAGYDYGYDGGYVHPYEHMYE
ncbi:slightly ste11-like protein [Basidiobolus ranarum]|uniref:Slightly ste11-like protein n=1 Tax=Basidiobolus ranarum TaxID=34480 RepID=A0ABR2X1B9_9FUNG